MFDPVDPNRDANRPTDEPAAEATATLSSLPDVSDRTLWSLGLAAILGDLLTTAYGLEMGLREQNPVVAAVLVDFGVVGLVALKLFVVAWVAVIWRGLSRRYGVAAIAGVTIPQGVAVVINVATILNL